MAITFSAVTDFFYGQNKLTERGENVLWSNRLISFTYVRHCCYHLCWRNSLFYKTLTYWYYLYIIHI